MPKRSTPKGWQGRKTENPEKTDGELKKKVNRVNPQMRWQAFAKKADVLTITPRTPPNSHIFSRQPELVLVTAKLVPVFAHRFPLHWLTDVVDTEGLGEAFQNLHNTRFGWQNTQLQHKSIDKVNNNKFIHSIIWHWQHHSQGNDITRCNSRPFIFVDVCWLLPINMLMYFRDGSVHTILTAVPMRQKLQNFLSHPVTTYWHQTN